MLTFFEGNVTAFSGNGVPAGLFVPISDLPGVEVGEFGAGESQATKEGKAVLAYLNAFEAYYSANSNSLLGLAATVAKASVSNALSNFTFTVQHQYVAKLSDGSYGQLPLPVSGSSSGVGGVAIADIFPHAYNLMVEEDEINGEGFVIPYADLADFGGSVPSAITNGSDNRDLFAAINRGLSSILSLRTASIVSAITASTQNNAASFILPAAATASTDPTTGIAADELNKIATSQMQTSYTIQVSLNQSTQTFDVNTVTA